MQNWPRTSTISLGQRPLGGSGAPGNSPPAIGGGNSSPPSGKWSSASGAVDGAGRSDSAGRGAGSASPSGFDFEQATEAARTASTNVPRGDPADDLRPRSLAAVDDEAVREVVRGHCDAHTVARQHADVMASHASRKLSANDRSALVDLDVVLAATERVLNDAFHLEKIALAHWVL